MISYSDNINIIKYLIFILNIVFNIKEQYCGTISNTFDIVPQYDDKVPNDM